MIREAVAATRWWWGEPPALGMVTFVNEGETGSGRSPWHKPGHCYRKAGFEHVGFTEGGLWAFQLCGDRMPEPAAPRDAQYDLLGAA
jgi:hypothetical protein